MPQVTTRPFPDHPMDGMKSQADIDDQNDGFSPPTPSDGFNQPSEEVKRRNLITATIILGIVLVWVVYGLRGALF